MTVGRLLFGGFLNVYLFILREREHAHTRAGEGQQEERQGEGQKEVDPEPPLLSAKPDEGLDPRTREM